jgi:type III restriction enzyme
MALELKEYQQRCLSELEEYLALATRQGAKSAFMERTDRPYQPVAQLPGLPYVCLRVPTGGGKTLMACHALGIAAQRYLHTEAAVCVWLVPSKIIRDQTLAALRDRRHPYRQALDARFRGQVEILNLTGALYVQRPVMAASTVVIVSTLAALRVEDTDGRKVYEAAGALSNHFSGLSPEVEAQVERDEYGVVAHSLCNVLRLHRPLVIVDEAHNARTELSFDTLARLNPSGIIEFTATPARDSNVLCHVSALELKAEAMIKLPIELVAEPDWRQAIAAAVARQRRLEELATGTGDYLRPIVLLQAQPRREGQTTQDYAEVKRCLVEDCGVPAERVAIATGEIREIDGVDLKAPSCPIRFIITVQALKEGWDCSFAYVLCSAAEMASGRAVEQILGRVLRMPGAQRQGSEELNKAYAYVTSTRFAEAASALRDGLVQNGFEKIEAQDLVRAVEAEQAQLGGEEGLFAEVREPLSRPPDVAALPAPLRAKLEWYAGEGQLGFTGDMKPEWRDALRQHYTAPDDREAVERMYRRSRGGLVGESGGADVARLAEPFEVPHLAVWVDGVLELFEDQFLDVDWRLSQCDARLETASWLTERGGRAGEVDVDASGHLAVRFVEQVQEQLALLSSESGWTIEGLALWLDRQIPHPDIVQSESSLFIYTALALLIEAGVPLDKLAARKFRLRDALAAKIDEHRQAQHSRAFQRLLFGPEAAVEVSPERCFRYDPDGYAPNYVYEGPARFNKHYHRLVGELALRGEETDCAIDIENHPAVKRWVRNLACRPAHSFWLQTSTDKFYPDFVAQLVDGRILVVEYKGVGYRTNDDSKEKDAIGRLWAERSSGRCLFLMATGDATPAIDKAIAKACGPT